MSDFAPRKQVLFFAAKRLHNKAQGQFRVSGTPPWVAVQQSPVRPARATQPSRYNNAMRFRLRTLLIVLALAPPMLAWAWLNYDQWARECAAQRELESI